MHFLSLATRTALRSSFRPTRYALSPRQSLCPFTTQPRLFLKEDADRSAEDIEQHKQENLKKQEKGEGEWNRNLASRGEESIAADKDANNVEDHDEHMEDLQKQTAGKSEQEHPEGKAQ